MRNIIVGISGIWLLFSVFVQSTEVFASYNFILTGIIVAVSGFTFINKDKYAGWIWALIGIWLIISSFAPRLVESPGRTFNAMIIGVIILLVLFLTFLGKQNEKKGINTQNNLFTN